MTWEQIENKNQMKLCTTCTWLAGMLLLLTAQRIHEKRFFLKFKLINGNCQINN